MPGRPGTRQDIIDFLSTNGPIRDSRGRATAALKQAVGYEGNDGAFIQIVSAMARAGQIDRAVKGKRTYELRLPNAADNQASVSPAPTRAQASPAPVTVSPERAGSAVSPERADSSVGTVGTEGIDYDELAAVLLARVTRLISDSEHGAGPAGWTKRRLERLETRSAVTERELARARADLKEVEAERDDLRSRLEAAEHNLSVLSERHRPSAGQTPARRAARHLGTEDRALLHRLTGQQREEPPSQSAG